MADDFEPSTYYHQQKASVEPVVVSGNRDQFLFIAAVVNSALYLIAVLIIGFLEHNRLAWELAIFTFALCYLSPLAQSIFPKERMLAIVLLIGSVGVGALAGISLLFGG